MNFISDEIEEYTLRYSEKELEVLKNLSRETYLRVMSPRMLSGHLQGSFLSFISRILKPLRILEIGTYTGYSAICLAQGLMEGGKLITLDINEETEEIARRYVNESKLADKIELITGDAQQVIPLLKEDFDLVFIDADKKNYSVYYDLVFGKVKQGGIIIADNVLWSGKVISDENKMDADTLAIHQFNEKVSRDERVEKVLLPIRDGLMMIRKK
jgi:caffeoyl-CoA O-methyltransferase